MKYQRQVFYSFHYKQDSRRAAQIRNIGAIEGNAPVSDNDWEEVKKGGDETIRRWIDSNMRYRSCLIVLVGEHTSKRRWVDYEIRKAWEKGMGVFGIYIHRIKDPLICLRGFSGYSNMGENPFDKIFFKDGRSLSSVVPCYRPNPSDAYNDIAEHLEEWVEKAIKARG